MTDDTSVQKVNFGFCKCVGKIGDFVWMDSNGNGCQDPGEAGIAGVEVTLSRRTGSCGESGECVGIATTVTDSNGFYLFEGLCPGDYCIEFNLPGGLIPTVANADCPVFDDGQGGRTETNSKCEIDENGLPVPICVTLTPDDPVNLNIDCGVCVPGAIGDRVWEDTNGDGCRNPGEPACVGVVVNLFRADCDNGVCQGDPIRSTTIDDSGSYLFDNLCPGDYCVEFVLPPGTTPTIANAVCPSGLENSKCEIVSGLPVPICVRVGPGESILEVDCGCSTPPE